GHTLAHAIEAVERFGGLLHGEAVAVGMVFAARLGERLGQTAPGTARRLGALTEAFGLPVKARRLPVPRVLEAMGRDKKRGATGLRWVLLTRIGHCKVVEGVPERLVVEELRGVLGS
ncbi:MAG: 3-dehydroquinate synthase, partial [Planctomycetes bacterium]|nr:3-dehydroquinate synthase [Planctomycetota bacterium]